jgi:hypothetical protein
VKTNGKTSGVIIAALRKLQYQGILNFGDNMKSITPDNGSEF